MSLVFIPTVQAQEVTIGDEFIISSVQGTTYNHLIFPRKNFIIKRGGIANTKSVKNLHVIVQSISYDSDGNTLVELGRKDGGRFFRSYKQISARLEKALEAGELRSI
ncbi:MAG: hypothetical protein KJO04_11850 [Bacteroidia bacterium]|nr:hypothetical protein [Bacteroidia bacterium]